MDPKGSVAFVTFLARSIIWVLYSTKILKKVLLSSGKAQPIAIGSVKKRQNKCLSCCSRFMSWIIFLILMAPSLLTLGFGDYWLAMRLQSRYQVHFTDVYHNRIAVMDSRTHQVFASTPTGGGPSSLAIDPDHKREFVTNQLNASVSVIDTVIHKLLATIQAGNGPWNATLTPDGKEVWIPHAWSPYVSVIVGPM
jgi:YVTN family beta-propeller protein